MVRRLEISPENGILLSRQGVALSSEALPRLMDPRFRNLQVHASGSGSMTLSDDGNQRRIWTYTAAFPALEDIPIVFVNARRASEADYVDYPETKPPRYSYTFNGPEGPITVVVGHDLWVREDGFTLDVGTHPSEGPPFVRYQIMKNTMVF